MYTAGKKKEKKKRVTDGSFSKYCIIGPKPPCWKISGYERTWLPLAVSRGRNRTGHILESRNKHFGIFKVKCITVDLFNSLLRLTFKTWQAWNLVHIRLCVEVNGPIAIAIAPRNRSLQRRTIETHRYQ